jgi:hypothetical protein
METKIREQLESKNLSESTINVYMRNLRILNDKKEIKSLSFLTRKDEIMNKLNNKNENTKRNYLITICSILNSMSSNTKLYKYYYDELINLNRKLKEQESKNIKTEKQDENWIEQDEVNKILFKRMEEANEIYEKYKEYDILPNKKLYNKFLETLVLALYTLQPPRRNKDYILMKILKSEPKETDDKDINYIDMKNGYFYFNNYKTSKTELKDGSSLKIKINDKLFDLIRKFNKFNDNTYLLSNYDGNNYTESNFITKILNNIFKDENKKISSTMLRHIFLSNKFSDVSNEQQDIAKKMSHSVDMQKQYIKK